jgi:UDP-2,3-diacylglucosamine hydrolase
MLAWHVLRAVLADLHLGQRPGDLTDFCVTVEMLGKSGAGEVIFLGDLFRALVGFSRFWDGGVRLGLAQLASLRAAGVRVVLLEGNREFFLDAADLSPYLDVAGPVHSFATGGRRFLLEHGDLINPRDRAYHFWRAVSKSAVARAWARLLPGRLARRIVFGAESRLAETNFSYRVQLPTADLEAAARRHFVAGVDVVLWGHFHRTWSFASGHHEAHVLPAWLDHRTVVWIDEAGVMLPGSGVVGQIVDTPPASWYQGHESAQETR